MANFCRLDDDNKVIQIVYLDNNSIKDGFGVEREEIGVSLCKQIAGDGKWVQTSFNSRDGLRIDPETRLRNNNNKAFRAQYGAVGMYYYPEKDVFAGPPPNDWFELDRRGKWVCPPHLDEETGRELTDDEKRFKRCLTYYQIHILDPYSEEDKRSEWCLAKEFLATDMVTATHGSHPLSHLWLYETGEWERVVVGPQESWVKNFTVELDLAPAAWITRTELNPNYPDIYNICWQMINTHPQGNAHTVHELFRLIIEWAYTYTEFNNEEPSAEIAHKILRIIQMPEQVRNELLSEVPQQVIGLYLAGLDPYLTFTEYETNEPPPLFAEWSDYLYQNYHWKDPNEPVNVSMNDIPDTYPV